MRLRSAETLLFCGLLLLSGCISRPRPVSGTAPDPEILPVLNGTADPSGKISLRDVMVKLEIVCCSPNCLLPWQNHIQKKRRRTGVLIGPELILTTASAVWDSTCITVRRSRDGAPAYAEVLREDPQCDLALLKVTVKGFFHDIVPVPVGELPPMQSTVILAVYPPGSGQLAVTEGILSRMEMRSYSFSGYRLPAVQFDAAFDYGPGGGVFRNGFLAGIAFQGNRKGEGLGYMIPAPVIRHFLTDALDGRIDGFGSIGFFFRPLINPQERAYRKVPDHLSGILVTKTFPDIVPEKALLPGDILIEFDGKPVTGNGEVREKDGTLQELGVPVAEKQIGEEIPLKFLRNGKSRSVRVRITERKSLIPSRPPRKMLPFFIRGGLVFTPLTEGAVRESNGRISGLPDRDAARTEERKQCVLLSAVLKDRINLGYHDMAPAVLQKVNGVPVRDLKHAASLADSPRDGYVIFEFKNGSAVFHVPEMQKADSRIRRRHNAPADRLD